MIVKISELQPGDVINTCKGYTQTVLGIKALETAYQLRVATELETYTVNHPYNQHVLVVSRTDES
jgi:hypothetical protein